MQQSTGGKGGELSKGVPGPSQKQANQGTMNTSRPAAGKGRRFFFIFPGKKRGPGGSQIGIKTSQEKTENLAPFQYVLKTSGGGGDPKGGKASPKNGQKWVSSWGPTNLKRGGKRCGSRLSQTTSGERGGDTGPHHNQWGENRDLPSRDPKSEKKNRPSRLLNLKSKGTWQERGQGPKWMQVYTLRKGE